MAAQWVTAFTEGFEDAGSLGGQSRSRQNPRHHGSILGFEGDMFLFGSLLGAATPCSPARHLGGHRRRCCRVASAMRGWGFRSCERDPGGGRVPARGGSAARVPSQSSSRSRTTAPAPPRGLLRLFSRCRVQFAPAISRGLWLLLTAGQLHLALALSRDLPATTYNGPSPFTPAASRGLPAAAPFLILRAAARFPGPSQASSLHWLASTCTLSQGVPSGRRLFWACGRRSGHVWLWRWIFGRVGCRGAASTCGRCSVLQQQPLTGRPRGGTAPPRCSVERPR